MKAKCSECGNTRRCANLAGQPFCRFCLNRALKELAGTDSRFEEFWAWVVRKDGKVPARKAWMANNLDEEADTIIRYFKANRNDWQDKVAKGERAYIPHPATILNQRRWLDEGVEKPVTHRKYL